MMEKHILIIEDDADIKDILTAILSEEGYQITAILEANDIIKTVLEIKPDMIITDYILHGINGGEYCSQIKNHPETSHLPVIILSGYGKVLESLGHYGADMIINKPFENEELCNNVASLLHGQSAAMGKQ
ncbi:response regulator [uncultured Mucilaginibacter sp.]|uniref:response regulator n=1 Tax=uncultured Mucilaginibacter sp. TaxID=797541 RepID=UPI0025E16F97|nr:response regulator [uncultured Mucilaginibacter sp.]